jgi:hypothetical protein
VTESESREETTEQVQASTLSPLINVDHLDVEHFELDRRFERGQLDLRAATDLMDKLAYLRARIEMCLYCSGHRNMCNCNGNCIWSTKRRPRYERALKSCDRRIETVRAHVVRLELESQLGADDD